MAFASRQSAAAWPVFALLAASVAITPAGAERPRIYALTGATVVVGPGRTIEGATVVLRDGLIQAVGTSIPVPADAETLDMAGRYIYPALIDAHSDLGVRSESGGGQATRGTPGAPRPTPPGAVHPLGRIQAERRIVDALASLQGDAQNAAERIRNLGFGAVLATPTDGILRGVSAAILLVDDRPVADMVLRDGVAQNGAFERAGFGEGYPTSLMGSVAALRQVILDARQFAEWSRLYAAKPAGMNRPPYHAAYDAMQPLVAGKQPLFFETSSWEDSLLADEIAREYGLVLVLSTSGAEYEVADLIAATGRKLIVSVAVPEKPDVKEPDEALSVSLRTLRRYVDAPAGPARLHDAGVVFALTLHGLKNSADFPRNVRAMIEAGLPEETALAALTTIPAGLLGLDAVLGTLEAGKLANVIVADGPLFGEETKIREMFVDGVRYEIKVKDKPQGDPNAVVDPRGDWSVTFEMGPRTVARTWTITGDPGAYSGTAETREGTVDFEEIKLAGNALTVRLPGQGGRGGVEVTVIIEGDSFEGSAEMGSRSVTVKGTRSGGPGGGAR